VTSCLEQPFSYKVAREPVLAAEMLHLRHEIGEMHLRRLHKFCDVRPPSADIASRECLKVESIEARHSNFGHKPDVAVR
jgi:hypothetical protein